jgi:N-methylhydantoinase B
MLHDDTMLTTMFDRRIVPPYGLQGGRPGACFRCTLVRANGDSSEVPGKANVRLHAGDRVLMESSGGGGYGSPVAN